MPRYSMWPGLRSGIHLFVEFFSRASSFFRSGERVSRCFESQHPYSPPFESSSAKLIALAASVTSGAETYVAQVFGATVRVMVCSGSSSSGNHFIENHSVQLDPGHLDNPWN